MFTIFVPLQILPVRDGGCCESLKIGLRRLPDETQFFPENKVLVMGRIFVVQ